MGVPSTHYGEDVDFCVRVRAFGRKIFVAPDAVARHRQHNSLGRPRGQGSDTGYRVSAGCGRK